MLHLDDPLTRNIKSNVQALVSNAINICKYLISDIVLGISQIQAAAD